MVTAIILSGGIGVRFSSNGIPKQYKVVRGKPIVLYVLEKYQRSAAIDRIIIVASPEWRPFLDGWIERMEIGKFFAYADPGAVRQESILSGMKVASAFMEEDDTIVIHDAVRPLVTDKMIADCVSARAHAEAAMMAIPSKETLYLSADGRSITALLDRSQLVIGQTPESYAFGKYFRMNAEASLEELSASIGCSGIAFEHGMQVVLIPSDERNFKITTIEDLNRFEAYLREEQGEGG